MAVFSIFVNSPAWMRLSRAFFLWRSRSPETSRLANGDCSWFMVFGSLSGGIRMKIDFVVVFGAIECEPRHPSNQRVVRVQGKDSTASFLIIYRVLNLVK